MNDFFKKIKGFFKDDESFFEAKQLLEKNWHNLTPDYFKKLLKSLNYAAFVIDVAGNYIFLNEEARRLVESKKPSESNIWKDIPGLEDTEFGKKTHTLHGNPIQFAFGDTIPYKPSLV